MLEARPGNMIFIGNGDTVACHHPAFDFNDAASPHGVYWVRRKTWPHLLRLRAELIALQTRTRWGRTTRARASQGAPAAGHATPPQSRRPWGVRPYCLVRTFS